MAPKREQKAKLTDAERHKRFKEMAREVGASDKAGDFERAFKKVISPPAAKKSGAKRD
jgi:hypothetical protein